MEQTVVRVGTEAGYLRGYVDGEFSTYVTDTPEQISAFILHNKFNDVLLIDLFDSLQLIAITGFIDRCANQTYMQKHLLPVLYPMQIGETDVIEFVPHIPKRR